MRECQLRGTPPKAIGNLVEVSHRETTALRYIMGIVFPQGAKVSLYLFAVGLTHAVFQERLYGTFVLTMAEDFHVDSCFLL